MTGKYEIKLTDRGEGILYSDGEIVILMDRTYCDGHRLYCDSIGSLRRGPVLPFSKRKQIIQNLCDYFATKKEPTIFVLDEADKDLQSLESLFEDLSSRGHKLFVEYDNGNKREKYKDDMYISILKAGKKLSINGVDINSIEEYWQWKNKS